ncbi:glycosyltransferase family 4 protein [Algoriphagus litoralis]|uniref:glycosyltransferase family 4 protein n=1 Tax=Algoriphagus litoralis TaxID=2202829 RepID=UPI000DB90EAA|nr:glycosyltransferase family 4 protein [Algoriphagus litoralis]
MKKKLLYITPSFQSFVKTDLNILQKYFELKLNHYPWQHKSLAPLFFILQFLTLLPKVYKSNFVIVNFGGYWAFWPIFFAKLFQKKSAIIVHGTDCAAIPEINYGSLRIPTLKKICGWAYSKTDLILPVSDSLIKIELKFDPEIINSKQGIKEHYPNLNSSFKVIYNGLDENFWKDSNSIEKEKNSFLSVMSESQFKLKGGDLIVDLARIFPFCQFYFAGINSIDVEESVPPNVHFLGKLNPKQLLEKYQQSEFYFQLSSFEGFGCALAEAMLCGCIPIGSSSNHIPSIIGDSGFILQKKDINLATSLLKSLLLIEQKQILAKKARTQIINNYSLEIREKHLISVISNLL